jgi:dCMP deaminase
MEEINMKRPSIDEYYLGIAKAVSTRSTCIKKHYGAVIVKNGEIIATGYNNPPRGEPHCWTCTKCDSGKDMSTYIDCPAVHAEMNAIISASRNDMLGADLYLAGYNVSSGEAVECEAWPCEICLRLIKNAGIDRIINNKGVIYMRADRSNLLLQLIEKENN